MDLLLCSPRAHKLHPLKLLPNTDAFLRYRIPEGVVGLRNAPRKKMRTVTVVSDGRLACPGPTQSANLRRTTPHTTKTTLGMLRANWLRSNACQRSSAP